MLVAARRKLTLRRAVAADRPVAEATATNGTERRKARPCAGLFAAVLAVAIDRCPDHCIDLPMLTRAHKWIFRRKLSISNARILARLGKFAKDIKGRRMPLNQRVRGSSPGAPTKLRQ